MEVSSTRSLGALNILNLKSVNRHSLMFYTIILTFFIVKLILHGSVGLIDIEEANKTEFLFMKTDFFFFFPGEHPEGALFGHPGLNSFLYFLYSKIFGASLYTARSFSLLISCLFLLSFYNYIRQICDSRVAFYSASAFLCLPMFQVQSILFLNEIGSLLFIFIALSSLYRERLLAYCFFSALAVFYLESAVAFPISIILISLSKRIFSGERKYDRSIIIFSLIPILMLVAFFVCEYIMTGSYSNHITSEIVSSRLTDPHNLINILSDVLPRYFITIDENLHSLVSILILLFLVYNLVFKKRKWSLSNRMNVFIIATAFFVMYFTFFSEHQGGRDLYVFFIPLYYFLFYCLGKKISNEVLCFVSLFIIGVNSYMKLGEKGVSHFQTTLSEYERADTFKKFSGLIGNELEGYHCYKDSRFILNNVFCRDYYGIKTDLKISEKIKEPIFILLFKNDSSKKNELYEWSEENNYSVKTRNIGNLEDKDVVAYLVSRRM